MEKIRNIKIDKKDLPKDIIRIEIKKDIFVYYNIRNKTISLFPEISANNLKKFISLSQIKSTEEDLKNLLKNVPKNKKKDSEKRLEEENERKKSQNISIEKSYSIDEQNKKDENEGTLTNSSNCIDQEKIKVDQIQKETPKIKDKKVNTFSSFTFTNEDISVKSEPDDTSKFLNSKRINPEFESEE